MKSLSKIFALGCLTLLGFFHSASDARAQGGCYPYLSQWNYRAYSMDSVPYFALHPPVYYSFPVPRTYGYSPFAYPFGTPTPEVVSATAQREMINPYVPQEDLPSKKGRPMAQKTARIEPKIILNPYVTQDERHPTAIGE